MSVNRIKKLLRNVQLRIVCIVIILAFVPGMLLLQVSLHKSEEILMERASDMISGSLNAKKRLLQDFIQSTQKLSSIASTNKVVTTSLSELKQDPAQFKDFSSFSSLDWARLQTIQEVMANYQAIYFTYKTHHLLIGLDGSCFSVLEGIHDELLFSKNFVQSLYVQEWYRNFLTGSEQSIWYAPCAYRVTGEFLAPEAAPAAEYRDYAIFVRKFNEYTSGSLLGISVVSVAMDDIRDMLETETDPNSYLILTDGEGKLICRSSRDEDEIAAALLGALPSTFGGVSQSAASLKIDDKDFMVSHIDIEETGWRLFYVLPNHVMTREISELWSSTMVVVFGLFIFVFFLCVAVLVQVTRPITRVVKLAQRMRIGGHVLGEMESEVYDLSDAEKTFGSLLVRIEQLVDDVLREQQIESNLRYESLRAQINPHFLFNTLNSIKWSAAMCGAHNIAEMIADLGGLLEATLASGDDYTPLVQEIELIKTYVHIKNMTRKYLVTASFSIDDGLSEYPILKFLLQPLVENAIIHGIGQQTDGHVRVSAAYDGGQVVIRVADNGQGIPQDRLRDLMESISREDWQLSKGGIGLKSISGIVRLKYGQPCRLHIDSIEGEGTVVSLYLPRNPKLGDQVEAADKPLELDRQLK